MCTIHWQITLNCYSASSITLADLHRRVVVRRVAQSSRLLHLCHYHRRQPLHNCLLVKTPVQENCLRMRLTILPTRVRVKWEAEGTMEGITVGSTTVGSITEGNTTTACTTTTIRRCNPATTPRLPHKCEGRHRRKK